MLVNLHHGRNSSSCSSSFTETSSFGGTGTRGRGNSFLGGSAGGNGFFGRAASASSKFGANVCTPVVAAVEAAEAATVAVARCLSPASVLVATGSADAGDEAVIAFVATGEQLSHEVYYLVHLP